MIEFTPEEKAFIKKHIIHTIEDELSFETREDYVLRESIVAKLKEICDV